MYANTKQATALWIYGGVIAQFGLRDTYCADFTKLWEYV